MNFSFSLMKVDFWEDIGEVDWNIVQFRLEIKIV